MYIDVNNKFNFMSQKAINLLLTTFFIIFFLNSCNGKFPGADARKLST